MLDEPSRPDYLIDIVSVSKIFNRSQAARGGYSTLKSLLLRGILPQRKAAVPQARVIDDLTLRIRRGSSVGIIGRNGSGKSTLLKLITGIYRPTNGTIAVRGRIAALIELGAGFHPDFTGRENLYLGGVMHGLTRKQVDERFDDIVEFAELRAVIDEPIRTYSSGMFMRLGFSLAIHTDPDVLIIDEVLAVGDAAFVAKCKERISSFRREGRTLLFVSHDLDAVERWCDEALWLHEGEVRDRGEPRRVIDHYRSFIEKGEEERISAQNEAPVTDIEEPIDQKELNERGPERWGSREIEIEKIRLLNREGDERALFHPEESVTIEIEYRSHENTDDVVFGIGIERSDGVLVYGSNTDIDAVKLPALGARGVVRCEISRLALLEGRFSLDVAVHRTDGYPYDYHRRALSFVMRAPHHGVGVFHPEHQWVFETGSKQ